MTVTWSVGIALVVAGAGAVIAARLGEAGSRWMRPLVYLALLFFGLSALLDILPASKETLTWSLFLAALATGYGTFWVIGRYVAPICPACAMRSLGNVHRHAHGLGLAVLAVVFGLHAFFDGLGLDAAASVTASVGLRLLAAIAVHKLPEGFAMTLMFMVGGREPRRAFTLTAGIESATLAGAVVGQVVHPSEFWLALILANVGGTFLYLAVSGLRDLLVPASRPIIAEL